MEIDWRTSVWQHYGAAIDMLEDAIRLCPDHLWTAVVWNDTDDARYGHFWWIAYHTLSWLDLFVTGSMERFVPPPPFQREGLPQQPYTKEQIQAYLDTCRRTCQATIEAMTDAHAQQRCVFAWMEPSFLELQLSSMRHVQEHAAQLNLVLGHHAVGGLDWVAQARSTS